MTNSKSGTIATVVLVLSSLLMIAGVVQIFAQDFYRAAPPSGVATIHDRPAAFDAPQSQRSAITGPQGVSLAFESRYPGVTMIVVAGVLQVFLMLFAAMGQRAAAAVKDG